MTRAELQERFEFRNVRAEEADQTIVIENICFPPNEACSPKSNDRASFTGTGDISGGSR